MTLPIARNDIKLRLDVVNDEQCLGDYLWLINHPEIVARNTGLRQVDQTTLLVVAIVFCRFV